MSDDMHGRGVATLLLEHLVSVARQHGLTAFEAETLPDTYGMQRVFAAAGLPVRRRFGDGIVELTFPLPEAEGGELDSYLDAVAERGSQAEVASLRHLFEPASVAVVARPDGVQVADVRARLAPAPPRDPFLRRLR